MSLNLDDLIDFKSMDKEHVVQLCVALYKLLQEREVKVGLFNSLEPKPIPNFLPQPYVFVGPNTPVLPVQLPTIWCQNSGTVPGDV